MQGRTNLEYWLFQMASDEYARHVARMNINFGPVVEFSVDKYADRITTGDIVFIWIASNLISANRSDDAHLAAWGAVEERSRQDPKATEVIFPVRIATSFSSARIGREETRAVSELFDLRVVQQGQLGVVFPLSTRQAAALSRLVKSKGYKAPEVSLEAVRSRAAVRLIKAIDKLEKSGDLDEQQRDQLRDLRRVIDDGIPGPTARTIYTRIAQAVEDRRQLQLKQQREDARNRKIVEQDRREQQDRLEEQITPEFHSQGSVDLAVEPSIPVYAPSTRDSPDQRVAEEQLLEGLKDLGQSNDEDAADAFGDSPESFKPIEELAPPLELNLRRWWEEDRAGIVDGVHNFSKYIARRDLVPPLSIGIFGDWGVGKTFFMNALQNQIANIAWQSGICLDAQRGSIYCRHVCQINFNAWHYVESNLWASLTSHILESLYVALVKRGADQREVERLYESLETAKEATKAAIRARDEQAARVKDLEARKAAVEAEIVQKRNSQDTQLAELRIAIASGAQEALNSISKEGRERLEKAIGKERLQQSLASGRDLVAMARSATTLAGSVRSQIQEGRWWPLLVAAVVIIIVPPALNLVWDLLGKSDTYLQLTSTLATYATGFIAAASWILTKGKSVLDVAGKVQAKAAEARAAAEERQRKPLRDAEEAVKSAKDELGKLNEVLAQEQQRLAAANVAIESKDVVLQLKTFLEDRVRNKTYEQHLGLITLVRRDFEWLSTLMESGRVVRANRDASVEFKATNQQGAGAVPLVERIVLYIDDLDRCPHEKVVDVLQAIHLLLGFPLFVVVVGVDVRWVGSALTKHYGKLLGPSGSRDSEHASADDYLEKLFQIPYRIPPLSHVHRQTLLTSLVEKKSQKATVPAMQVRVPPLEMVPTELELDSDEERTIISLHASLGSTPRRINRFVAVYRLMRAGMSEGDVEVLTTRKHYKVVLALFALLNGSPIAGPRLLQVVQNGLKAGALNNVKFAEWLGRVESKAEGDELSSAYSVMQFLDGQTDVDRGEIQTALLDNLREVARYSFRRVDLLTL